MFRVPVVIGALLQTTESKRRIFTRNEFSTKYDNILLMGDFNFTIKNKHLEELLSLFNLKSPILSPTCFKSTKPTCIDFILTNQEELFSNSNTCEVGISDHYHLDSQKA